MVGLLCRDDWGIRAEREVDAWVRHQVGLELSQVNVELTVETERGRDGRNALGEQPVQVGVGGALDVEVAAADVIESLIVDQEGDVGVLKHGVCAQHGVVWLNNHGGDLRRWVDGELNLGLLAIVNGETVEEERAEARTRSAAERVEDHESLETRAVVGELAASVKDEVDNLLANGVVATGIVVGGVLLAGDELLRVVEVSVCACADLVNAGWLEVNHQASGNELSSTSLSEEGVEGVVLNSGALWLLAVGLDAVLYIVKSEE